MFRVAGFVRKCRLKVRGNNSENLAKLPWTDRISLLYVLNNTGLTSEFGVILGCVLQEGMFFSNASRIVLGIGEFLLKHSWQLLTQ